MTHDLLLTLGHNSSAILVESSPSGNRIVCGYEEERFTLKKSDSSFPINAITRCMQVGQIDEVRDVYVTHWDPAGELWNMSSKHWRADKLPTHKGIITHNTVSYHLEASYTHHDCHAMGALWYATAKREVLYENSLVFVIDGFGNFGEHISIYKISNGFPQLIRRFFGYEGSLGLMYQYMTAFMGMKMHEDEYKILGYEVLIDTVDVDKMNLDYRINKEITRYLDLYFDSKKIVDAFDPLIRIDALPALQKSLIDRWQKLCKEFDIQDPTDERARVILGYYVQSVLEGVVLTLIKIYKPTNLLAAGGVFYNVKLNRKILDHIPGKLSVFPLAGDQGGALGLYSHFRELQWPGHLNWGIRPKRAATANVPAGIEICHTDAEAASICADHIETYGFVNLVRGAMEFGPRAMCNTSTLAAPLPAIVNRINRMNGRNTVMPMAPVMNRAKYRSMMKLTEKVHHSEEHMIVALPYKEGAAESVLGAAHPYPDEYTGRPQVLDGDPLMDHLFTYRSVLINTSFNVHGRPIAYSFDDVIANHVHENKQEPITTVYLEGSE